MKKQRIAAFLDGFNLYNGIRDSRWKYLYWFDPAMLIRQLVAEDAEVVCVKYFTARVRRPDDKRKRQDAYLDAIRAHGNADIILGKFHNRPQQCRKCHVKWMSHEEKMTDSAIASHMVADAFLDTFDTAITVGGDTDIVPAIRMIRTHFPEKTILVWFPPRRKNQQIADICDGDGTINQFHLKKALMPDRIEVADGVMVERPKSWS